MVSLSPCMRKCHHHLTLCNPLQGRTSSAMAVVEYFRKMCNSIGAFIFLPHIRIICCSFHHSSPLSSKNCPKIHNAWVQPFWNTVDRTCITVTKMHLCVITFCHIMFNISELLPSSPTDPDFSSFLFFYCYYMYCIA